MKTHSIALAAAATAGELAGIACEAALLAWDTATGAIPKPWPAAPVVDDETVFDEAAAEKYLRQSNVDRLPEEFDPWLAKPTIIPGTPYRTSNSGPFTWAEIIQLVEHLITERLTAPADGVADASSRGPAAGECPAPHLAPGIGAGHLNLNVGEREDIAFALRKYGDSRDCPELWHALADKVDPTK